MSDNSNNTGNSNTGHWNTGNWNTGHRNTGNWNTGYRNTGDWNTGDSNTGHRNTGNSNTGNSNTGYRNTGDWNTGDWNTCDNETGFFNTVRPNTIRVFNKECDFDFWSNYEVPDFLYFDTTRWIPESQMSEQEKEDFGSYKTTGGYLKELDYKEAFQESYNKASDEEKEHLLKMPNFDADIFYKISGIDVKSDSKKDKKIKELEELIEDISKQLKELKEK